MRARPRRVLRAAHASGTRAPRSRPAHARRRRRRPRCLDDLPAVRHAVRAFEHRAADDDAILVARELHPVRAGRAAVDVRRQPAAGASARPHPQRVARPPEIDDPQQLAVRALQLRDARADTVETAARRAIRIAHERRIVGARGAAARLASGSSSSTSAIRRVRHQSASACASSASAIGSSQLNQLRALDEIQRTRAKAVALQRSQAAGQSCERAWARRGRPRLRPPLRPRRCSPLAGSRGRHRQHVQVARPTGRLRAACKAACLHLVGDVRASRASTTVTSRVRLSRALPTRVAGRRAAGRVDRVQAAGFQLRPRIGQAVDREPAHVPIRPPAAPSSARRRPSRPAAPNAGRWHRVPYSRRSPSNE